MSQTVSNSGAHVGEGQVRRFLADGSVNSGVIAVGAVVYMTTNGKVAQKAASSSYASNGVGKGLVGVARNASDSANDVVEVELFSTDRTYVFASYGTAPTLALMGAAATLYTLYNDAGVIKVDLSTTANGVANFAAVPMAGNDPFAFDSTTGIVSPKTSFSVGDNVEVKFPASVLWA